jgi:glucosyl-dolichyl phosphate glucuronosyltransferase
MQRVKVSIIICTRNRAESLLQTLESIGQCEIPADMPAELLVVDNGSVDHTREVVEQTALPNMRVRYVLEPKKGNGQGA